MVKLPLATNARAKMQGFRDGFVKLFARRSGGTVLGGVVVAPRASELILAVSLAVEQMLTVDQMAHTFAVYPSLSGSLTEAARQPHAVPGPPAPAGWSSRPPRSAAESRPASGRVRGPQSGPGWPRDQCGVAQSGSSGTSRPCWRSREARMSSA